LLDSRQSLTAAFVAESLVIGQSITLILSVRYRVRHPLDAFGENKSDTPKQFIHFVLILRTWWIRRSDEQICAAKKITELCTGMRPDKKASTSCDVEADGSRN
jgi:hypothetical protein